MLDRENSAFVTVENPVRDIAGLEALYGTPAGASLGKVTPRLTLAYRRWIEASRFFVIASVGAEDVDCSPRGDVPGELIEIVDD
ncbi:MAG: pyridoxamine 5'-phosphate oxidase family protein, partial [Pseudomonadota bacterium]